MSTTRLQNIGPAVSDNITTKFLIHGSLKCWTAINGTGTIAIRDSFNTTSITDNGVGRYQTNITNLMKVVSYFSSGTVCYHTVDANEFDRYMGADFNGGNIDNARTTGLCRYGSYTAAYVDPPQAGVFILGDLA